MKKLTPKQRELKKIRLENKRQKRLLKLQLKKEKQDKWDSMIKQMFERDKGCCVFCGKKVDPKHYQTCHIIPREFEELMYDINNVLLGCFYHHKVGKYSMHQHPLWLVDWLKTNRNEQYEYLMKYLNEQKKCPTSA